MPNNLPLRRLLETLNPRLNDGVFVFVSVPLDTDISVLPHIAAFREQEGLTLIVAEEIALSQGLAVLFRAAWITLTVHSELDAVGLTAAVATALAAENISCNVVAAARHDHLFVPCERASDAMRVLTTLQSPFT